MSILSRWKRCLQKQNKANQFRTKELPGPADPGSIFIAADDCNG